MVRLTIEEILDLPYHSILAYLSNKGWNLSQGYNNNLITAIIYYQREYLLRDDDRQIVQNPDFISTFKLSNTELIRMMSEQEDVSIFTNKAEILRSLLHSEGKLMTFGYNWMVN